jgi:hypothetical protein
MRRVECADALTWLEGRRDVGAIVTSLPDAEEIGCSIAEWREWFGRGVESVVRATSKRSPAIFYQTDRKSNGATVSKEALVFEASWRAGARVLWHKIVLRRDVGKVDLHRPGFTHLIAVSAEGTSGTASPDVLLRGRMVYPNAMGVAVAAFAVKYAALTSRSVVDPFCGRGTVVAMADALGLDAVGVDIDPEQVEAARSLDLRGFADA